jgi:FkbM family methyltransferase
MTRALISERLAPFVTVDTGGGPIRVFTPTGRSLQDPWKFFTSEPETIRWLNELPQDEVLWDIGANIGVYTLYAAKTRGMRVLAFEPSAASYACLVRNLELNGLGDRVSAYCLAFDDATKLDNLNMANTAAGHSMHAFGQDHTVRGAITATFRQAAIGFSIDDFCRLFSPPPPAHIKLDVGSIELKILRGATRTLSTHVKTVMVETDDHDGDRSARAPFREFFSTLGFAEDTAFEALGAVRNVLFRRTARV